MRISNKTALVNLSIVCIIMLKIRKSTLASNQFNREIIQKLTRRGGQALISI